MTAALPRLDESAELDGMPIRSVLAGLAQLHQLVVVCSSDGRVLWMSDALGAICGNAAELVGMDFRDLVTGRPEDYAQIARDLGRGDSVCARRLRLERTGGRKPLIIELNAFPIDDGYGGDPLLVGIVRRGSVSAPKAHAGSDATDPMLAALLEAAPDAVVAVDRSGFVNFANAAAGELLGRTQAALIDRPLALLMSGADGFAQLMGDMQDGIVSDRDVRMTTPAGRHVSLSVSSRPLCAADGSMIGSAAYLRDVTEREQLAGQLTRKAQELESYVQTVSHDLRSPLVAVLGFSRLLREDYSSHLDSDGCRFVDRIEQGARTMDGLIRDLLDLSRIGRGEEVRTSVDPAPVLRQLRAELKARLEERGTRLEVSDDLPLVHCESTRIYQIFANLIENALNHMGPCRRPEIRVRVETLAGLRRISVSDNGRGIAPEDQARIFEVFQTVGDRTRSDGRRSTGMGLAIVKKIAESHGGTAWVESRPGEGATFFVTLEQP